MVRKLTNDDQFRERGLVDEVIEDVVQVINCAFHAS